MSDPDAYIALVSSLPSPERLFRAKQPPLSRLRLERRLAALSPADRACLAVIEKLMSWTNYEMSDDSAVARARSKAALDGLQSATLQEIVQERMDLRAVIAALRMRRDGQSAPAAPWAQSRLIPHIRANWSDPGFKLETRLPWLKEALALLEKRDPLGLERHMLDVTHRQLQRHGAKHHFDFEAVVIYVLRWDIFDRWAQSDARAAARRFETLAQEALGDFADIDLQGVS
ncbi:MAG: DUF2764 family protein [Mangrovicoccus sp.]|nr:DUF2764 family protein [Mangrovicoccus sp.]